MERWNGDVGSIEMVSGRWRRKAGLFSLATRKIEMAGERARMCNTANWKDRRRSIQWLQSQEQKLLRARSVAVIRMLMRIDRGHLATRGQTREFRGVARAESFLRRVCTHARVRAPRWNTHVQGVPARDAWSDARCNDGVKMNYKSRVIYPHSGGATFYGNLSWEDLWLRHFFSRKSCEKERDLFHYTFCIMITIS